MLPRSAAFLVIAAGPIALVTLFSACSGTNEASPRTVNVNVDDGAVTEGICPAVAPDGGDACLLPEGTACAFGACGTPVAACTRGLWQYAAVPANPPCPASPPASDTACPPCFPSTMTCSYGSVDCSQADASANRTVARCASGSWALTFIPCADASTDVQRDGAAEKD